MNNKKDLLIGYPDQNPSDPKYNACHEHNPFRKIVEEENDVPNVIALTTKETILGALFLAAIPIAVVLFLGFIIGLSSGADSQCKMNTPLKRIISTYQFGCYLTTPDEGTDK